MNGTGYNYDDAFVEREANKTGIIGFALSLVGLAIPGLILCIIGTKKKVFQSISAIGIVISIFWIIIQAALVVSYAVWKFDPLGLFLMFR